MDYTKIFLTGDCLLFRPPDNSPVGETIKAVTAGPYSHVAFCEVDARGVIWIHEMREFRGYRRIRLKDYGPCDIDVKRIGVPVDIEKALEFFKSLEKVRYSYIQILKLYLNKLPIFRWRIRLNTDDKVTVRTQYVCSGAYAAAIHAGGLDLVINLADEDTTPVDIGRVPPPVLNFMFNYKQK